MARDTLKHYAITLVCFLTLDAIWLGLIAQPFYQAQIGFLLARNTNLPAAGAFYLLYVAGLVFFVVGPALRAGTPPVRATLRGAFFGLVTYATYDLTNLATIDRWPLPLTVVDMAWGTLLGALTTLAAVLARAGLPSRDHYRGDGSIHAPQQVGERSASSRASGVGLCPRVPVPHHHRIRVRTRVRPFQVERPRTAKAADLAAMKSASTVVTG